MSVTPETIDWVRWSSSKAFEEQRPNNSTNRLEESPTETLHKLQKLYVNRALCSAMVFSKDAVTRVH